MEFSADVSSQKIADVEITKYTEETKQRYELTLVLDNCKAAAPYIFVFGMNHAKDTHKSFAKVNIFADEQHQ